MKGVWCKTIVIVLLIVALSIPAFAFKVQKYSGEFDVTGTETQVVASIELDKPYNDFVWQLPSDAEQIIADVPTRIIEQSGNTYLTTNETISKIEISYVSKSFVERADGDFFILDLARINTSKKSILLKLPEDAKLKYSLTSGKASIIPKTDGVITDGRRIIIRWTENDFISNDAILVLYEVPKDYSGLIIGIVVAIIIMVGGYYLFTHLNKKKIEKLHTHAYTEKIAEQKKEDLSHYTKNLFEDEKLIVQMLLIEKTHELWQKQLTLKTGLTKVKLSRKIRSLEAKGLIEKIPYGNTNKIRLKKN